MYLIAPLISSFYDNPELIPILRILTLKIFPGTINSIQIAIVARNMLFKKIFKSSFAATIISGVLGIISAYLGLGVWALVIQQLSMQISISLIMWFTVKWRPIAFFSIRKVKDLFSFGWKMLGSSLISILYDDLRTLIIGRIYTPATLGYYNRGQQIPRTIVNGINNSIQSVMLPTLSAYQDNKKRLKSMMRRSIKISSYFIFPMMIGLAMVAESLVVILLTEDWLPSVVFFRVFAFYYSLIHIHMINLQAISALGRSDLRLKLEILKKVIGIIILLLSIKYGVIAIAIGQLIYGIISSVINALPNKYLLDYGFLEQISDLLPSVINSSIMGGFIYFVSFLDIPIVALLFWQIVLGGLIYLLLSIITKDESYIYIISTLKEIIKSRKKLS